LEQIKHGAMSGACTHLLVAHKLDGIKWKVTQHEGAIPCIHATPDALA